MSTTPEAASHKGILPIAVCLGLLTAFLLPFASRWVAIVGGVPVPPVRVAVVAWLGSGVAALVWGWRHDERSETWKVLLLLFAVVGVFRGPAMVMETVFTDYTNITIQWDEGQVVERHTHLWGNTCSYYAGPKHAIILAMHNDDERAGAPLCRWRHS